MKRFLVIALWVTVVAILSQTIGCAGVLGLGRSKPKLPDILEQDRGFPSDWERPDEVEISVIRLYDKDTMVTYGEVVAMFRNNNYLCELSPDFYPDETVRDSIREAMGPARRASDVSDTISANDTCGISTLVAEDSKADSVTIAAVVAADSMPAGTTAPKYMVRPSIWLYPYGVGAYQKALAEIAKPWDHAEITFSVQSKKELEPREVMRFFPAGSRVVKTEKFGKTFYYSVLWNKSGKDNYYTRAILERYIGLYAWQIATRR